MIQSWCRCGLAALILLGIGVQSHAAQTRPTYPTAVGVEALGRAASYSFFVDRMLDENLAAGVGYGGGPISMVPVYANYYLSAEQASLYLTAAASLVLDLDQVRGRVTSAGDWVVNDSVIPVVGLGYENRSDQGALFRVAGYGAYANATLKPWVGVSLGYAF